MILDVLWPQVSFDGSFGFLFLYWSFLFSEKNEENLFRSLNSLLSVQWFQMPIAQVWNKVGDSQFLFAFLTQGSPLSDNSKDFKNLLTGKFSYDIL